MCDSELQKKSPHGKGRRWQLTNLTEEPFSGNTPSFSESEMLMGYVELAKRRSEKAFADRILNPEKHTK